MIFPYYHILKKKKRIVCIIVYCIVFILYNRYLTYPWKHVKWTILIGSVASRFGVPRSPGEEGCSSRQKKKSME